MARRARAQLLPCALALLAAAGLLQCTVPSAFSALLTAPRTTNPGLLAGAPELAGQAIQSELPRGRATSEGLRALPNNQAGSQEEGNNGWKLLPGLSALSGLVMGMRRGRARRGAAACRAEGEAVAVVEESTVKKASTIFCNMFAVWLALAAVFAVKAPATFTWVKSSYFTGLLGLLMFSVGITTTLDDFKECLKRPGAVAINFVSCYGIMPVLAFAIAKAIGAEGAILAGLVLVGAINGGQASNLCTLIAGGDVALSVLMTTSTTLGCIFMTPLICKMVLGTVVPVDAMGIVVSTFQVVLAPIFLGVGFNTLAPDFCKKVAPFTPVVGVIATVLLVGASVAKCAGPIMGAGLPLQLGCLALHLVGGILGYFATSAVGYDERTCRTVAIETAMKSSAFGFLLASLHFGAFNVRVPSAVSVVWMAIVGSVLAVYWKGKPTPAAA